MVINLRALLCLAFAAVISVLNINAAAADNGRTPGFLLEKETDDGAEGYATTYPLVKESDCQALMTSFEESRNRHRPTEYTCVSLNNAEVLWRKLCVGYRNNDRRCDLVWLHQNKRKGLDHQEAPRNE